MEIRSKSEHLTCPPHGGKESKREKKRNSRSRAATQPLGLRELLGHGEVVPGLPEFVDTVENFGKECCEGLCVLSIHANYVAAKTIGGGAWWLSGCDKMPIVRKYEISLSWQKMQLYL